MQTFGRLKGNVSLWTGALYHSLNEQETARKYVEKSVQYFEDTNSQWNCQLSKQHLCSILIELGEYDKAFEIFQNALSSPMLQNPFNQSKTLTGLCDVYCSIGKPAEGLEWAEKAQALCQKFGLNLQMVTLQKILTKHRQHISRT
jgi:tetratricopeptide (TPR) repeat protein